MRKYFVGLYFVCLFYIPDISAEATLIDTESKNRGIRAIQIYTSQKNSHVTIKCDVNLSKRQLDEPYTIKWTASGSPFLIVIETFSNKEAVIDKLFTGRVELVNGTSLKISRLQNRDAKDYICRVKLYGERYEDGQWIRLKVNDDPIPSTTQSTNKPVSIKSNTNTPTTSTIVVTPLSVTTNTARDGGGDDTESDGSGEVKVYTDVSGDKLHTEKSILPKLTNSPFITKTSLIGNVHESTYELDVETTTGTVSKHITTPIVDVSSDSATSGYDKNTFTRDRGQSKTDISESNTHTKKVSLSTAPMMSHSNTKSLTKATIKTTNQSEQQYKTSTEKAEITTISRNETSSPTVDMTRTRISTETTPEPVIITEAAIKTTNQSEQEHKMPTETKSEITTISRNGTSSPSVDITRTRISTETTPEPVIITESSDKSETNSLSMGELTTAPSVKVSMTTLSVKESYLTSTTLQQLQTTTDSGSYFNVTITDRNPKAIKLQVIVYSTKDEEFTNVEFTFRTEDRSTTTRSFDVSGHKINETFRINKLEIGICYKFQIHVRTQNGRSIGPNEHLACTTPRRPDSSTDVVKTTATSIYLLIQHPSEGHFDSFRIDYKKNARLLSMTTVNKSVDVNETKINISGLLPKSCYNIDVYTVSFSEISKNPRTFSNVCTQAQLDPNNYTVIYGDSSFMISWVNFSDKYNVTVSCNSWTNMFSLKVPSLSVNKTVPGDCCVLNVKNWNDTVSRQYFVHVNETLPEYPVVIRNVTTRTHLNLTWREPIRSNGWIHGYTVHLFDSTVTTIKNFTVSCIQPEPKCSDNDSDWKHQKYQCSSFSLINNRSAHNYYNNSQFHLSIGGFKPGMLYHYSITAMNKAGSNTTDRIPVFTQADKPESPSSLDITVLNVTTMNITWSPPNVTNGVIMGYRVQYCSNGSSGCKHTVVERMTSVILKDLDCWKEYLVCVSAQTSAGVGRSTCGVNNTSVYEPQSKISKTTASNTTIRLEFEVPCDSVEAPISYNISYTSLDHSCTGDQTNVTRWWECFPLRPCEITGLFPYWDYFIKVQESAENNVGVWSNEYKVTTLHSVPEEVRNVRAENIKSDSLTVCWEQPCFLNSDTVFYNVMLDEDTPYVNVYRSGSIPETECANITDLLPYTNYTISVTASNQYGNTDPVVIMKQTDIAEPESPASLDITVLNVTTMNITWSPPNVTNGVIIGYNVSYCSKGISGCNYTVVEGRTSVILKDLDCWKEYLVCVSAQTSAGVGRSTCGVNNTSVYEPQAQITKITASNTTIRIEIEVPCDSVELPFSYDISYTSLDHSCTGNQTNVTQWIKCFPLRPCEITGLFSYWDYFIQVLETVGDNVGVWGNEHKVTTLHYVPEKVRNIRLENIESDRLTVCWEQPCFLNSDTVFYNVTLDDDTPHVNVYRSGSIPETECENITDLLPYTNYTISVTSSNQYGNTDPVVIMKQTDIAVPNQPSFGRVLEHTTMLTVEWKPPYPYPGPTRYTVKVRDIENSETKHCQTSVYNQTRCSVNGLEEYWQYEVTIMAHTDRGNKQYKHPHYIQTKQSAPGPVTHLRVNHEKDPEKPRLVFITFGPPVYRERNGVIKAYYVKCHDTRTNRDIHVVKLNKNLTELKIIVPDQVLLNISVFAETVENGTEIYETVIVPAGAKDFPTTEALAGVSLAFIVFIIAAIVVVILYRRHMVCFKPQFELKEKELVQLKVVKQNKKISVDHEDTRKSRPVKIDKFYQHVEILARDSNHFFSKEYKELKAMAPMLSTEAAEQQEARTKNRYSNILPFDHSRVKLLPLDDEEGSDYINANYIPGFNSKREYIATQGPLPSTKDDFWRMIWEQNVSVIVMLTQCIERGKRKCECYWPECVKEPVYYGDLSIEIENESHLPEYVLRTISVTFGNIQKRIMHFLYLAWPDMGVPSSTDNMISLVKTVRSHVNPIMKGPITVHCSAGVGRTGTFINVDILLHQLDNDYNQIDVFGDVLKLRNHRCNMVQTEDQYVFIHHCISDYILAMSEDTDEEEVVDGGDEPMYQNVPSKK